VATRKLLNIHKALAALHADEDFQGDAQQVGGRGTDPVELQAARVTTLCNASDRGSQQWPPTGQQRHCSCVGAPSVL
jgi:hypothetical protein